ncbi:DUF2382 domain-containing protein [Roseomonas elaeocarpi]|uniref:DUF2382 domain-containing protein n=1 Tax=Roseomonas elaeocarpi TaxID=907779 RepID=A0ABV6JX73_9PROT
MSVDDPAEVVPVAEEHVLVTKRVVETGRVRVSLKTEEVTEAVRETLHGRRVEIEHVPIDREVDRVPGTREEDGVLIVPVVEEVLVVEKRLVLKEEIRIRTLDTTEVVDVPVTRRVQAATVLRSGADDQPPTASPATLSPEPPLKE